MPKVPRSGDSAKGRDAAGSRSKTASRSPRRRRNGRGATAVAEVELRAQPGRRGPRRTAHVPRRPGHPAHRGPARPAGRPVRGGRGARQRRRPKVDRQLSRTRSCSPASATPTSAGPAARTSSCTPSASPRSAPACGSTPPRCAPRCCTTPSRTPARRWRRCEAEFGEEVAALVDGVTKLTGITFQSRDDRQAENYRKMMVAMAQDIRVILIKLADRLHNMRTIDAMPKHKQQEKAKETLEIFAPLAHRLGIHAIKWELEDLAFATLHPRKYNEIKGLVNQQRERARGLRDARGRVPGQGARGGGHRGRDLRPRQALLLDLLEDDQEGARVQRDLRPHRDARAGRLGQGLLRRHRRHPLALEAAARAASRTGSPCPSSTCTRRCTRR